MKEAVKEMKEFDVNKIRADFHDLLQEIYPNKTDLNDSNIILEL